MVAAINLQRDAGVMLSNLQILSQFAMAMNRMSFSMMALCLGQLFFPRVEVDDAVRRREQLGRHRICRPSTCGTLRLVFLDQFQCCLAACV